MPKFFALFFLPVIFFSNIYAKDIGRLPYKNFTHRDYYGHFQNWAIVQDDRGLMYFGNTNGVLEYDGSDWRIIPFGNSVARCFDIDDSGRIWVGGQDEFGYLAPDSIGNMTYFSLNHLVEEVRPSFGLVRQVYNTSQGVVFSTNNCIFQLNGEHLDVWYPQTFFHRTYKVFDNIYSVQPDVGLTMAHQDTFKLVPGGEYFAKTRIYSMLPYDEESILIATQAEGLFLFTIPKDNEDKRASQLIHPFSTTDDIFFKENWVYHGAELPNGRFAFATYRGGAIVIDSKGEVLQYIGKEQGIQDETVWYIYPDNQDNIWLALNNGISYTAIISPITSWDVTMGLQGVLQSVNWKNNTIYVSTNAGVFYLKDNSFLRVKGLLNLSWDITRVNTKDGNLSLLVGTGDGVYIIDGSNAHLIENGDIPTFRVYPSKYHSDIVYLGLYDGLGVAKYERGRWKYLGRFDEVQDRVYSIAEDNDENLWFTQRLKSIVKAKVSNPKTLTFDSKEEFSDLPHYPTNLDEDTRLVLVNNEIKLSSQLGLHYFDVDSNVFLPDYSLGTEFGDGDKGIRIFNMDDKGNLWFESFSQSHSRKIERAILSEDGTFIRLPTEFNEIPRMIFYDATTDDDGITWITGTDGLYRFDPLINQRGIKIPRALIRSIYYGQNKPLFEGAFRQPCPDGNYICTGTSQQSNGIPVIPFADNTITFHFSSPFFGQEERMQFSYMLEGFDEDWSDWSNIRHKEYTNLPHGTYRFLLKTLSVYEVESPVTTYTFTIERPWYNHPLMYFGYFVLLGLIVFTSVSIKTKMLKASNLKLQNLVEVRTNEILLHQRDILEKNEELHQQKEEIQAQRDELAHKNQQTKASIQYALNIQQAILPKKLTLDKYFDNFIVFKPKDVVSGDFYWFSQLPSKSADSEKLFLAVVDCTGHGVPGAFMSMIGSRMLSEIVNERRILDPATILAELNASLNLVLHQDSSENFDGMDVCLITIERITKGRYLVAFSGANLSISYYKQGTSSLEVLKGNRKSIGGFLPDIDQKFDNNLIDLVAGDSLFLYSDGITDQNNEFSKKFSRSRLNSILLANMDKPMEQIGDAVDSSLKSFMGDAPQRDDMTLLGIRLR